MNITNTKKFLFEIADVLEKHNIEFCIFAGNLLGLIRDGDFIPWDKDIDLAVRTRFWNDTKLFKKVAEDLIRKNISLDYIWNNDILRIGKYGIPCHIIYLRKNNKEYYQYANSGKHSFPLECMNTFDEIKFCGRKFKIPHNSKKLLENTFGKSWKIPMKESACKRLNKTKLNWKSVINKDRFHLNYIIPFFEEEQ